MLLVTALILFSDDDLKEALAHNGFESDLVYEQWVNAANDRGVELPAKATSFLRNARKVAHDSGDGETIYHCPFCGSGQVLGRSDGTAMCDFCSTAFTVQVQPERPSQPQTINGNPVQMPGMPHGGPGGGDNPAAGPDDPNAPGDATDPGAKPNPFDHKAPQSPQGGDKPGDKPDDAKPAGDKPKGNQPPWLKGKSSARYYMTADQIALPEDSYLRHLAIKYAEDKDAVLASVRDENERKVNNA